MTIEELSKLSDEELNVKLDELRGINPYHWKFDYQHEDGWDVSSGYESEEEAKKDWLDIYGGPTHADPIQRSVSATPYCTDLNAVAEVELTVPARSRISYMNTLREITETPDNHTEWDSQARNKMQWLCATARQRTIALILCLTK